MFVFALIPVDSDEIDELVRLAKAQNAEAFGQIYDLTVKRIYKYVYFRVKDSHEAEDLTEEVFLRALDSLADYQKTEAPFAAWLFRIAHNLVIDHYRRSSKVTLSSVEEAEEVVSTEKSLEDLASDKLEHEKLLRSLSRLSESHREVIVLKFIEGLSNKETGGIMGKTEGAIKSLQHRALITLKRYMEGE